MALADWYLLRPDEAYGATVEATHLWSLPGVRCPVCKQTWAGIGPAFPHVDLTGWLPEREYRKARAVSLQEYQRLRDQLQAKCQLPWALSPGTEFGPLRGRVRAKNLGAFVWQNPWTLLATSETEEVLTQAGCSLSTAATRLRGPVASGLREVECIPAGRLLFEQPVARCSACGRQALSWPRRIVFVRDTLPSDRPVFRAENFTTMILASRAFADTIVEEDLTGVQAEPIETVP